MSNYQSNLLQQYKTIVWEGNNLDDCINFYSKVFQLAYDCDKYGKNEGGRGLIVPIREAPDSNCWQNVVLEVGGVILIDNRGNVSTIHPYQIPK